MIDKIAWLHLHQGQLLSTRSYGKNCYYLPGGKREAGETDAQTLLREIQEELTVVLDPTSLEYAGTFEASAHGHPAGVLVRMSCYWAPRYTGHLQPATTGCRNRRNGVAHLSPPSPNIGCRPTHFRLAPRPAAVQGLTALLAPT